MKNEPRPKHTAADQSQGALAGPDARRLFVETALATLRAAFRPKTWNGDEYTINGGDNPEILRAIADQLDFPYLLVAAAVFEITCPKRPPVKRLDLDRFVARTTGVATKTTPLPQSPAAVRVLAIRDALIAMLDQNIDIDPNSEDETRQIAAELGVPALVPGIIVAQWYTNARFAMRDVLKGLAWLKDHGVEPEILCDDDDPEGPGECRVATGLC